VPPWARREVIAQNIGRDVSPQVDLPDLFQCLETGENRVELEDSRYFAELRK